MNNNFRFNLKYLREKRGLSQSELSRRTETLAKNSNDESHEELIKPITQASIARWEAGEVSPSIDNIVLLAHALDVSLPDLIGKDYKIDNADFIDLEEVEKIKIPVLGVIKAGIPIEAQENIVDYVEIPKDWTKGNKKYYALKIKGDSMEPKYIENDIVIFEQNSDVNAINKKDCVVMVNGQDATFKNVSISENGITLIPLNLNNSDGYQPTFYSPDMIIGLPVRVIGIAKRRISDL